MIHVGKFEDGGTPAAGLGFEDQLSTKGLSEKMCQKCSKPHTLSNGLGCKERLDNAFQDLGSHSSSLIANEKAHSLIDRLNGLQHDWFAVGTGVKRILYQGRQCFNGSTNRNEATLRIGTTHFDLYSLPLAGKPFSDLHQQFSQIGRLR